jgi:hypothetical protein
MWVIVSILGDPLLQSVTTTKSKNNDFLTRCSLLLFVKNKYFVIPRLKFFSQRAQRERRGREGEVNRKLKEDMALFTVK